MLSLNSEFANARQIFDSRFQDTTGLGNQAIGGTQLIVQSADPQQYFYSGTLKTANGEGVGEAEILAVTVVSGETLHQTTPDSQGNWTMSFESFENGVCIRGSRQSPDPLLGISLQDLVLIQKHILNVKHLGVYGSIAADVTGDGNITAADLVLIRKLMLGKIDAFPGIDAWKFVVPLPEGSLFYNALLQYCPQFILAHNLHLIAIRMGDVNHNFQ